MHLCAHMHHSCGSCVLEGPGSRPPGPHPRKSHQHMIPIPPILQKLGSCSQSAGEERPRTGPAEANRSFSAAPRTKFSLLSVFSGPHPTPHIPPQERCVEILAEYFSIGCLSR